MGSGTDGIWEGSERRLGGFEQGLEEGIGSGFDGVWEGFGRRFGGVER